MLIRSFRAGIMKAASRGWWPASLFWHLRRCDSGCSLFLLLYAGPGMIIDGTAHYRT